MAEERLQKILARAGVASRRKVEELIRDGRVTVNGTVAAIGDKADLERDAVKLDGKRVQALRDHHYVLLYKPRGVMSTVSDPGGRPTVIDLVPAWLRKALVPVGRLDFLTEGLILLTDDGELAHHVAHPRYGCRKRYEVKVKGEPPPEAIAKLRAGVVLDGRRTAPCRITPLRLPRAARPEGANTWWTVELGEGRSRQIRDMFQRIDHPVQKLRRVGIGPVSDPSMGPGDCRELTASEVEALRRASSRAVGKAGEAKERSARSPAAERPAGARAKAAPPVRAPRPPATERAGKPPRPGRADGAPAPGRSTKAATRGRSGKTTARGRSGKAVVSRPSKRRSAALGAAKAGRPARDRKPAGKGRAGKPVATGRAGKPARPAGEGRLRPSGEGRPRPSGGKPPRPSGPSRPRSPGPGRPRPSAPAGRRPQGSGRGRPTRSSIDDDLW